jgi:Uma2 family endonuclease
MAGGREKQRAVGLARWGIGACAGLLGDERGGLGRRHRKRIAARLATAARDRPIRSLYSDATEVTTMALTKPAPGQWRYEDLLTLPDDGRRYEIIEGELSEMPAPSWAHAIVIANFILLIGPIVRALGGQIATAPLDVFFPGADPVQPDIIVLLPNSEARPSKRGLEGRPDLVVEVISPSNRDHDLLIKRALYAQGGVREYWLVDPDARRIDVLALDRDALHLVQSATDDAVVVSPRLANAEIPVADIFAGIDADDADA